MVSRASGIMLAIALVASNRSNAAITTFTEDFTTTTFRDPVATTADWNTVSGTGVPFPFVDTLRGAYDSPGSAARVAVAFPYAYLADTSGGVKILDITDPDAPVFVGFFDTLLTAADVAIDGNWMYVAVGPFGLHIVDISDPTIPVQTSSVLTSGFASGVHVSGDLVFVAAGTVGLAIIDVSLPTPAVVGTYNTPGEANRVLVDGDLAYVVDGFGGLQILDVTNVAAPTLVANYPSAGDVTDVDLHGDLAFVVDDGFGLVVLDVENPAAPTQIGSYPTIQPAISVDVSGDYAILGTLAPELLVLDISDPATPVLDATIATTDFPLGITIDADIAYVASAAAGLQLFDVFDLTLPEELTTVLFNGSFVAVAGDNVYVADQTPTLSVLDISDLTTPTTVGSVALPALPGRIDVAGDAVFITGSSFSIVSVADPTAPVVLSTIPALDAFAVEAVGNYAYLAGVNALVVVDISNPLAPIVVASTAAGSSPQYIAVSGDYAFVADGSFGLGIFDVSKPTAPTLVTYYVHGGSPFYYAVFVEGQRALLADGSEGGLVALDISNPAVPTVEYRLPGSVVGATGHGAYDYAIVPAAIVPIDPRIAPPTFPLAFDPHVPTTSLTFLHTLDITGQNAVVAANDGVGLSRVLQRDIGGHQLQSVPIPLPSAPLRIRVLDEQSSGLVRWSGSNQAMPTQFSTLAQNEWSGRLTVGSTPTFTWRADLFATEPGLIPSVSDITFEFRFGYATIDSIEDVPGDQGGWAYLNFTRSAYDFASEVLSPLQAYNVHRRIDTALASEVLAAAKSETGGIVSFGGEEYLVNPASGPAPPGVWATVATAFAQQTDQYTVLVPTVADSTMVTTLSYYYVSAHTTTPSVFFDSEVVSGYSVDNIAPAAPSGFSVAYMQPSGNQLAWNPPQDQDFAYFRVYRGSDPGFTPTPGSEVHALTTNNWVDPAFAGSGVYYKITAVDYAGNESDFASPESVTAVEGPPTPAQFALHPNVPNPFNPTTRIDYEVPFAARVSVRVFDAAGRLVRTLVDREHAAGSASVAWDGTSDRRTRVASGVYFYRMDAPSFRQAGRMVLVQ